MKPELKVVESEFFYTPSDTPDWAVLPAKAIIEDGRRLTEGVVLLLSEHPLAVPIARITPERLLALVPKEKMRKLQGVVAFVSALGTEVRKDHYFVETLLAEIEKLPPFTSLQQHQFAVLDTLRKNGCRFSDLPANPEEARDALIHLSRQVGVSLEYLLGNLEKAIRLLRLLGVRNVKLNLSALFHNFRSGFLPADLGQARKVKSGEILERASALGAKGVSLEIFKEGKFHIELKTLSPEDLDQSISESEEGYGAVSGEFRRFIDLILAVEEKRLAAAPPLSIRELLSCFKFSLAEKELVSGTAVVRQDDPLQWKQTELGRALVCLRRNLNWLSFSAGLKAAGDRAALEENGEVRSQIAEIRKMAGGLSITLLSGRNQQKRELTISDLKPEEILFDLYCLAVLEKRSFDEVLETACSILQFIRKLENSEPIVNLNALISARLAGEPYVTLLGTQGLVLRNAPIVKSLERLRGLGGKVSLTVESAEGTVIPIREIGTDEFRRAVIVMGRRFRTPHSPERILGVINDKIVPEIFRLPPQVIAPGPHDLTRLVELTLEGIPARYPLRRPWKKLDLDQLVSLGNCLEPGVRNCLGCPVNTLYGLVMKTALSLGFEEIITYEATGCFEVYSGIWPYTGKMFPSLHGVFGGVPSEMLGGLAAKRARLAHALKKGAVSKKILHLGWGGDGATFDIGFGNLSGLFSRLQKITTEESGNLLQRALYVCYDNEGYQNTGNQYSGASSPGGDTTTNPKGKEHPLGNELKKKPIVEIVAEHGVPFAARLNIHRQEHISRVTARALEDGDRGSFLHFLQPCTTGWKFTADSLTYELSHLSEEGGLFPPVTVEHGVPYLEIYPIPRNPGEVFLKLQARFKHLLGTGPEAGKSLGKVLDYYREEWQRNLKLTGFEGEIPQADRLGYLEEEHRRSRVSSF